MFTSAVIARRRVPAATWSSFWYLLSSYAVISYTENWIYVAFAAAGSWIGAFASITFLQRPPTAPAARRRRAALRGLSSSRPCAGTHNPWHRLAQKASAPLPKREDTAYGSRRKAGTTRVDDRDSILDG